MMTITAPRIASSLQLHASSHKIPSLLITAFLNKAEKKSSSMYVYVGITLAITSRTLSLEMRYCP